MADNEKTPGGENTMKLADLVQYQEGSIVSRALIDKQAGTVTVFAFDAGQSLSEHVAPFDALVNVVDGEAEILIEGRPHRVREGELILMPGGKPHALKAIERFKMFLVMVRK